MNYTDIIGCGDRSVTNRTPLLESYQDVVRGGYNSSQVHHIN